MIRVLHFAGVINRYDFIDSVLTRLDRNKFEVFALTVSEPNNRTGEYLETEYYQTVCLNRQLTLRSSAEILSSLIRKINEFKPHILQAHHYNESLMGAVAKVATRVPAFVVGHHYSDHIYTLTKGLKRKVFLKGEAFTNRFADRIVVPSQEVVDLLNKQGGFKEKIVQIPYGTDLMMLKGVRSEEVERLRRQFNLHDKFVGLATCRLNKEKGLDNLLHAVALIRDRYPQFRLIIAGSGNEEQSLRQLAKELDLVGIVEFLGWRKDTLNWIAASDLVFQPSLSESFCQVIIESLVLERPVVMTPVGIAPTIIVNGKRGGYLVPTGKSEPIADAICQAIENPEDRRVLALNGKKYIEESLTTEKTARKYEEMYLDLLRNKGIAV